LKDAGEVSLSGFFDFADVGQKAMQTAFDSGEPESFSIVFPTKIGATWTFDAIVTAFETGAELEDAVSFDATLKVTGKPTLAATAAG
jgi:predicted secreted protein